MVPVFATLDDMAGQAIALFAAVEGELLPFAGGGLGMGRNRRGKAGQQRQHRRGFLKERAIKAFPGRSSMVALEYGGHA
jgi:hypothetical protein